MVNTTPLGHGRHIFTMFSPAALSTLQDEHVRVLSEQNKQLLPMLETEEGISQSWENVWLKPCFFPFGGVSRNLPLQSLAEGHPNLTSSEICEICMSF
jgi:hypothetical protein